MTRTIPREVTSEDIAWLAGIIDGESSMTLTTPNVVCSNKIIYGMHIVNSSYEMLEKCKWIIDSIDTVGETPIRDKKYVTGPIKTNKAMYQITIRRQKLTLDLLKAVLPHLTDKRNKALKLINFFSNHKCNERFKDGEVEKYLSFTPVETKRTALV